jgi:cytochrome c peroxidase
VKRERSLPAWALVLATGACSAAPPGPSPPSQNEGLRGPPTLPSEVRQQLTALSPAKLPPAPADPTNRFADDARAAALGKKLFFDKRFSGPLLDDANNGDPGTLGLKGETGKVACASCHIPEAGFLDTRSPRQQISLGSSWTRRRAPSLLNVAQSSFLMWDGRRDTAFSQVFTPIEDPIELNSSRLFAAQQIERLYKAEYEQIFGAMPSLAGFPALAPNDAGCADLPMDAPHGTCTKPGSDDEAVTQIVVNMGKAIQAFTRKITCGRSRFDQWMDGQADALTPEEQAGAQIFVGKGACVSCHSGPFLSDQHFHNVGLAPQFTFFIGTFDDPGASVGLAAMLKDPLNAKGKFSDGDDGRDAMVPADLSAVVGAFKTPSLRCVDMRPSFTHTGQYRSLEDVVLFFDKGGHPSGYLGNSENQARNLTADERASLVAFLRALTGDGPAPDLVTPPELPADPVP